MRKQNWQSILHAFIDSRRNEPFQWGKNDCALFAADCVSSFTDIDYAESFRGKYRSLKGSIKALKDQGFNSVDEVPDNLFERIPINSAMKGDVVSIKQNNRASLGICIGHFAVFTGVKNLEFMPMYAVEKAWRVK